MIDGQYHLQVHSIFEGGSPVILLGDTFLISLREGGIVVQLVGSQNQPETPDMMLLTAVTAKLNWLMG